MSWLARSIANSLKLDDDDHTDPNIPADTKPRPDSDQNSDSSSSSPRGVKEDLSELTKTLTRQFWGVASFLAPPPPGSPTSSPSSPRQISDEPPQQRQQLLDPDQPAPDQDEDLMAGIRSDFAEIGGKFRSGFSKLSSNIPVSEISKIATNFLQLGSEADKDLIGTAVGVTEEVVAFAKDVAMHPETWLDFPVPDDDFDDFDMSDAQQEHALTVERLAPRLAALRMELCPGYMSDGCFWKIYFVLVHPRLNKEDALLLSTPQIVEARAMLSHELKNRRESKTNPGSETRMLGSEQNSGLQCEEFLSVPSGSGSDSESMPPKTSGIEIFPSAIAAKTSRSEAVPSGVPLDLETEKHPVQSTEIQIIDKAVVEEEPVNQAKHQHSSSSRIVDDKFEDDGDDWLKEESSEIGGATGTTIPIGNDEDVSFSDLEDDDTDVPVSHQKVNSGSDTSTKDSRDWVQLSRSSTDSVKDINPVSVKHAGSEQVSARNSESKEHNDWLDVDDIDVL